jgi:hypothetical protein
VGPSAAVEKEVEIWQVLLVKGVEFAREIGPAIWTGFEEVRKFFGDGETAVTVDVIHDVFTAKIAAKFTPYYLSTYVFPGLDAANRIDDQGAIERIWGEAERSAGLHDQRVLGEAVSELLDPPDGATTVLVTDVEIVPPPEWRYIIWDSFPLGAIVSLAPLDPYYWGEIDSDKDRIATIKRRSRAASLSIVGSLLGLSRCENARCFLFADVDSVLRLDDMVYIGPEHGVDHLSERGFRDAAESPEISEDAVSMGDEIA